MKYFSFLLVLLFMNAAFAQEKTTTLYLLRHAEKADASADPDLSAAGKERAQKLAAFFKDIPLAAAYATPYKRTQQTVQPVAQLYKLEITSYNPSALDLNAVMKQYEGKNVVIAGHSNTIPNYINKLLGEHRYPDIAESEFNHLYIVTFAGGKATVALKKL